MYCQSNNIIIIKRLHHNITYTIKGQMCFAKMTKTYFDPGNNSVNLL